MWIKQEREREREREREKKLRQGAHQISWACNPYVDPSGPSSYFVSRVILHAVFAETLIVRSSIARETRKARYTRRRFSIFSRDDSIDIPHTMFVIRFHASLMTREQNGNIRLRLRFMAWVVVDRSENMYGALSITYFRSTRICDRFLSSEDSIEFVSFSIFQRQYISGKLNVIVLFNLLTLIWRFLHICAYAHFIHAYVHTLYMLYISFIYVHHT